MNQQQFDQIVESRIEKIRDVLVSKGKEYADDTDRMMNFKSGAAMQGITPLQCLRGYMTKHITSLYNLLQSPDNVAPAVWDEKIGDSINYLILLEALLQDGGKQQDKLLQHIVNWLRTFGSMHHDRIQIPGYTSHDILLCLRSDPRFDCANGFWYDKQSTCSVS